MTIICRGSTVGLLFRLVAVRPLLASVGGLHSFDIESLVIGVLFEDVKFLGMGLGVELFDDSTLSIEPGLVLEANLTSWRRISYWHLHIDGLGPADLPFGCHIVCTS